MNPNVAIELGYALKALGTDHVLMIMNSHYGKRADMPFDLGGKGGPIMYNLPPDATPKQIDVEKRKLVAVLVDALKEYVPKPVIVPFEGMKPKIGQGIYFDDGEILGEDKGSPEKTKWVMPFRKLLLASAHAKHSLAPSASSGLADGQCRPVWAERHSPR